MWCVLCVVCLWFVEFVARCLLFVDGCSVCFLFAVYWRLFVCLSDVCRLMCVVHCVLFVVACCLLCLFVVCCLMCDVCCVMFVV